MKEFRELTPEEKALVQDNVALAQFLFHQQWSRLRRRADYGIDPDDLLSQAYYGLIRAALRYRDYGEEKGYSEESISTGKFFGVFARKSIIGQMLDHLRKIDHVHTLVRKDYKAVMEKGFASGKSESQIAEETGLTVERVQKVVRMVQSKPVNLEDSLSGSPDQTVGEGISARGSVESSALEASLREAWVARWESLPDLHRVVISLKYFIGLELPEIAEETGESLVNIRAVHKEALLEIHEAFVSRLLGA